MNGINIDDIISIVQEAGNEVMKVYNRDFSFQSKEDDSPLTDADNISNKLIIDRLNSLYQEIPFISEETRQTPYEQRKDWEYFWLIDPLDGTKEFIKKNGEFTINIALIHRNTPVLGVVGVPAKKEVYFSTRGEGAWKLDASGRKTTIKNNHHYSNKNEITVIASRSHLSEETLDFVEKLKAQNKKVEFLSAGSSLKFCLVAEGKADVYPRFGPTMEWDTAAAHAIVLEAGKKVLDIETGKPLIYNKKSLLNPFFIVE